MKISIRQRWLLSFLILILFSTVVLDILLNRYLKDFLIQRTQVSLERDLASVEYQWQKNPAPEAQETLARELGMKMNVRLTFIDPQGKVTGESDLPQERLIEIENHANRPEFITALSGKIGQSIRHSRTLRTDMMYVAIPLKDKGTIQGAVRIALPLYHVDVLLQKVRWTVYSSSFFAVCLALLLAIYLSSRMTRPIRLMVQAAELIAQGQFKHKIRLESGDELGTLGDSLNTMAEKLDSSFLKIQDEKQQLETILSSMAEGVMVLNTRGTVLLVNDAFKRIFNITMDPIGKAPIELIRNPQVCDALMQELVDGKQIQQEIKIQPPGNKVIQLHAAPIWQNQVLIGLVIVFHDITDIRMLEQVRKDFVANVSHELRTPLTAIQGTAETLLDGALRDPEYARKFIQNIYSQTQRMVALVQDLLCLSQIESGKIKMQYALVDLAEVIHTAMEVVASKAQQKEIPLQLELPDSPIMMNLDAKYFTQAMINLLDNAIKFSPAGKPVNIRLFQTNERIQIQVTDQGCGIPSEDVSRIFERFYRVDKSRSAETEGTGLGLAIVKHIVESHQGKITVESVLGRGTVFDITLDANTVLK